MIEDMRHLEVFSGLARELEALIAEYNRRTSGETSKARLARLRLEQNDRLFDLLAKQRRALKLMMGETPEPEVHFAEAVLKGIGGGGVTQ